MRPPFTLLVLACLALAGFAPNASAGDSVTQSVTHSVPQPVPQPSAEFREVLVSVGDDLFIAGQPTEQGLLDMAAAGVTTVFNLRTRQEMDNRDVVPFDEAAMLEELGMRYVHVPSGGPDTPYAPEMVELFDAALADAEGRVLLHCTVAWRASHLYTAWLFRYGGLTLAQAVAHGRAINLGQLPLEGFLGEPLINEAEPRP